MFTEYTPFEYLCIDIANTYGLDKELFEDRIQWVKDRINSLESLKQYADDKPLYVKAVMALRDVQKGRATGHLISQDSICSGVQLMSALTGCIKGARATGLINSGTRPDAYTAVTKEMNRLLTEEGRGSVSISRADAKRAVMTSAYGSRAEPENIFGTDTDIFYTAAMNIAPGAFQLMPELINTWNPKALDHSWTMPDGGEIYIPVMETSTTQIKIDELDGASITVQYKENKPSKFGLSNVANLVHSVDALVMRNMVRRCSYNKEQVSNVANLLEILLLLPEEPDTLTDKNLLKYVSLAHSSNFTDPVVIPYINQENVCQLPLWYAQRLNKLIGMMLEQPSFDLLTVHDAFRSSPVYGNAVRYWYKEILAEIAESDMLAFLMSALVGDTVTVEKEEDIADLIRKSNYALS